jgi:flagellar biosynthetic protein FliR
VHVKAGLSGFIAFILFPAWPLNSLPQLSLAPLGLALLGEVFIGITIGLMTRLLFAAVQVAGQLVGFQMGFGIVNVIDPQTSAQVSIIAQFKNLIALLVFLSTNVHHWFLMAIAKSFEVIPPLGVSLSEPLFRVVLQSGGEMFVIAAKLGAPVIAVLFLTSVALGLVARTVPQINVFIVGFPLKIAVGLLAIGASLPFLSRLLERSFHRLGENIMVLLEVF